MTDPTITQYVTVARRRGRAVKQIAHDLGLTKAQVYAVIYAAGMPVRSWTRQTPRQTHHDRARDVLNGIRLNMQHLLPCHNGSTHELGQP